VSGQGARIALRAKDVSRASGAQVTQAHYVDPETDDAAVVLNSALAIEDR
jgi:hypothetical protein